MVTITPANLAYKDKDGDLGEVKSLTGTDVTLLNNALQDIENLKLAYMPGYVKRDFSNVTQDGKDAAISWGMPDYSAGITISAIPFTAPSDGIAVYQSASGNEGKTYVNGVFVGASSNLNADSSSYFLLSKGDVITANSAPKADRSIFYPCKGV